MPLYANVNVFGLNQRIEGFRFNAYGHPELRSRYQGQELPTASRIFRDYQAPDR